ncbi:DUF6261 family protein [Saccharicrinis sp. 156]|uniref:DUF6261 family protein n=1 Tax=Saccharicrinis sp. 156 TaxID=3417574 RepID=UPI003D33E09F
MIESPMFYKFHTREYLSFSDRVLQISERYNLEDLSLIAPFASVSTAHSQMKEALTKAVSTELTTDVVEADAERDNSFIAFKHYLQACQKCIRPSWQEAADLLIARVRHYGWAMNTASYNKQSAQTLNLMNDLENMPELVEAAITIEAANWVADLKTAQTNFEQALEVRTQAKASQTKVSSEDATKALRLSYVSLFTFIEALQVVSPKDGLQLLIDEINTVIKEFNTNVRSRITRLETSNEM